MQKYDSKDEYIPKVGDKFQYKLKSDIWEDEDNVDCECLAVGKSNIFVLNDYSEGEYLISIIGNYEFRPIPTKADVEREKLNKILCEVYVCGTDYKVRAIQKAGFTIPKKFKRSEILMTVNSYSSYVSAKIDKEIADGICNLLGDLVEDDA